MNLGLDNDYIKTNTMTSRSFYIDAMTTYFNVQVIGLVFDGFVIPNFKDQRYYLVIISI